MSWVWDAYVIALALAGAGLLVYGWLGGRRRPDPLEVEFAAILSATDLDAGYRQLLAEAGYLFEPADADWLDVADAAGVVPDGGL